MSKQVSHPFYTNSRETSQRPSYPPQRSSGPRPISVARASQASQMMATSPGQSPYPGFSQYSQYPSPQPQFLHPHQQLMVQPGAPMQIQNGTVRMAQPPFFMPQQQSYMSPSSYSQGPQPPNLVFYSAPGQPQQAHSQPGGMRQPGLPPMGLQGPGYMPQPPTTLYVPTQQLAAAAAPMQAAVPQKRPKHVIPIIDPSTGHDVLADETAKTTGAEYFSRPQTTSSAIEIKAPPTLPAVQSSSLSADAVEYKPLSNGIMYSAQEAGVDHSYHSGPAIGGDMQEFVVTFGGGGFEVLPEGVETYVEENAFVMDDINTGSNSQEGSQVLTTSEGLLSVEKLPASCPVGLSFMVDTPDTVVPESGPADYVPEGESTPLADTVQCIKPVPEQEDIEPVATDIQEAELLAAAENGQASAAAASAVINESHELSGADQSSVPPTVDVSSDITADSGVFSNSENTADEAEALQIVSEKLAPSRQDDNTAPPVTGAPSTETGHESVEEPLPGQQPQPATEASTGVPLATPVHALDNGSFPQSSSTAKPADGPVSSGSSSSSGAATARASRSMEAVARYSYREDQWSPINPEGKKLYDREFLLTLQYAKQSVEKPEGLPQLSDIILDKPLGAGGFMDSSRRVGLKTVSAPDYDFTPGYVKGNAPLRGPRGSSSKNDRGRRVDNAPTQIKVIKLQREEVQLHHTDNAWKPLALKTDEADLSKTEELYRQFRSILNKLTPQKFSSLIQQVLQLPIDTEERLRGIINLVFEKAIDEPSFSVAYANMCKSISSIKVGISDKPGEAVDFRKLLLTRCQREFEKDLRDEEDSKAKSEAIDKAENDEAKKRLQDEYAAFISKARRRSLGNIRFIGELFKLRMLTEPIMHDCIMKLLKGNEEDSLECLCRLLTTIGKDIDHEKAKPRNDQYFTQMKKIIAQRKASSRVRFMLQDIVDLRENNWVPRRADNNPKTIDQIHQEVAMEAQEKSLMISQVSSTRGPSGSSSGRSSGSGREKSREWQSQHGEDGSGWSTVPSSKTIQNAPRIDPSKMKLSKQNVGGEIQLGPGGGKPNAWGRGSRPSSSQELERPTTPVNRFNALADESGNRPGRAQTRAEASKPARGQGSSQRPPSMLTSRASQEERSSLLATVKNLTTRDVVSRDSSQEPPRSVERPRPKQVSDEDVEKKAQAILEEYLHNLDPEEAFRSIEELQQPENLYVLVRYMVSNVLERSQQARKQTGQLLYGVVKRGLVSHDTYLKGLTEVSQTAEDLAVDIPLIWTYLGQLVAPMLQSGGLPINLLTCVCQPLRDVGRAGVLLAKILEETSHILGHVKLGDMWVSSGSKWSDFLLEGQDVKAFLVENKLEYLVGGGDCSSRAPVCGRSTVENMSASLEDMIVTNNGSNEDVFDWFEKNLGNGSGKEKVFVRALMDCIARKSIELKQGGMYELNENLLKLRSPLLLRFIDHNPDLELQALFVLQALLHRLQHPANVLRNIFDCLYDEDIISEEAFYLWQAADDPLEREGKGIALESTKQFFTWLQSAENGDA